MDTEDVLSLWYMSHLNQPSFETDPPFLRVLMLRAVLLMLSPSLSPNHQHLAVDALRMCTLSSVLIASVWNEFSIC